MRTYARCYISLSLLDKDHGMTALTLMPSKSGAGGLSPRSFILGSKNTLLPQCLQNLCKLRFAPKA